MKAKDSLYGGFQFNQGDVIVTSSQLEWVYNDLFSIEVLGSYFDFENVQADPGIEKNLSLIIVIKLHHQQTI